VLYSDTTAVTLTTESGLTITIDMETGSVLQRYVSDVRCEVEDSMFIIEKEKVEKQESAVNNVKFRQHSLLSTNRTRKCGYNSRVEIEGESRLTYGVHGTTIVKNDRDGKFMI
jgi:hypothetical protein